MSHAYAIPPGGILAEIRSAMHATAASIDDLAGPLGKDATAVRDAGSPPPEPFAGETKWPAWKVTLAVVLFCGAFWTGIAYLALRLFS